MPTSFFPAVISFGDQQQGHIILDKNNHEGFSQKMSNAIDVQEIDINLYMSKQLWIPLGARGVFGGEIVAQSLRSAWNTVEEKFHIHSLHSYFILAGDYSVPVIYNVQRIRDGRSFATRLVIASQRGKPIFVCTCSFSTFSDAINIEHSVPMPSVPQPEELLSDDQRVVKFLESRNDLPPSVREFLEKKVEEIQPVEYRDVRFEEPEDLFTGKLESNPVSQRWFKTREKVETDDPKVHAGIVAYASDSGLLAASLAANGVRLGSGDIGMMASLDHSIWFHKPCRADDWLLHTMHSPRTSDGRGTNFGQIYSRDGTLVATTAQEGIIRLSKKGQKRFAETSQQQNSDLNSKL
ncbi:unnamed protein product [Cunninghamella echinulata]